MTVTKVAAVMQFVLQEVDNASPRVVEFTYRGQVIRVQAKNLRDEANLRVDCKIRDAAIM